MKALDAHYDGKHIVLEEPVKLEPDTKVKVLVAEPGDALNDGELSRWLARLSESTFARVWDNSLDADYDKL